MFDNMQINEICKYATSLLFTSSISDIKKISVSTIDTEASLLSELSLINNDIQNSIEFNCSLIVSEYIDYLKDEILKINSLTMNNDTAIDLVEFTRRARDICEDKDDMLFKNIHHSQSKISSIISYDIAKSMEVKPISQSKTADFILSVKDRLEHLYNICSNLSVAINECDYLIEACEFSIHYKENVLSGFDGMPPILEESYETIISLLLAEYIKWKGDSNNVISTKNNI